MLDRQEVHSSTLCAPRIGLKSCFFAKFDEVAARIPSSGVEDIFETGSFCSSSTLTLTLRGLFAKVLNIQALVALFGSGEVADGVAP